MIIFQRIIFFGVLLSTLGVIYLVFKGNFTNIETLKNLNQGDLWAMGSAISWAFYCSFLRIKDKAISGNVFVTVSSVLVALILLSISIIYFISFHRFYSLSTIRFYFRIVIFSFVSIMASLFILE